MTSFQNNVKTMKRLLLFILALGGTLRSATLAQAPETRWTLTPLVFVAQRLNWYPNSEATATFATLRLGIPIRFKQQKAQPGYFLPGRAR